VLVVAARGPAKEAVYRSDWRRECATGGIGEARRQTTKSARTPPCLTHQSDEKQRLDACVAALERQIEELKAKVAELEAAPERKADATTEAPKEKGSEAKCQRRVTCRRVRIVAAAAPDDRERAALRRGRLTSDRVQARQNCLIDSTGVTEGDRVWLYHPIRTRGRSPKHHSDRQRGPLGPGPP
jgi:predicted RNase H-like nuclease (RuvC/YqgF family)